MHISKMMILSDFCMLSKISKMKSYVKINVISVFSVLKLTILAHQGIILTYVAEIMLILFKNMEIYINLFFKYFWPNTRYKKIKNNSNRLNFSRAFDWCMNCHILMKKNFGPFLAKGGPFMQKKILKIIFGALRELYLRKSWKIFASAIEKIEF